ncbi:hypothetical protein FB45DRAFT_993492 [Roridomyces roridus]|uniref:Uncharacterized protein n=1 Tax=Roridomyces roridus TaxID=1738132 RepID=A0AAD7F990_9AGAR|nr:hypothetical protein FB45DRAFT_993492 [Roridomyces roridus]
MKSFSTLLRLDPFDTQHGLVTSPFFSSRVLATIRLVVAAYTFAVLVFSVTWGIVVTKDAAGFFSYFTHLSYTGICGYFFAAGFQTLTYARRGQKAYPLQRWAKPWRFLHLALLSTITTYPLLVSVVFWGIIAPDESVFDNRYDAWSAISVHLLNSVFALFEILLTNTPLSSWLLLPFGLLLLSGYVGIVYITYATQGFYAYTFMAPDGHPLKLALHILGVAAAECVVFAIAYGLVFLRQRVVARFFPSTSSKVSATSKYASAAGASAVSLTVGDIYGKAEMAMGPDGWSDLDVSTPVKG